MPKDIILAIESSGRTGSAAIGRGNKVISEITFSGFMRHSQELFTTLEKLLHEAGAVAGDIEHVYITAGPGSFTGLRIAVTTAKMFAFSQKVKLVAADSMDVIAENASRYEKETGQTLDCIATILDAKKHLFYAGVFEKVDGVWQKCFGTDVLTAEQLLNWLAANKKQNVGLLGDGLVYYAQQFEAPFTCLLEKSYWSATAAGLFRVGRRMAEQGLYADPCALVPKYLRKPDAVVKTGR